MPTNFIIARWQESAGVNTYWGGGGGGGGQTVQYQTLFIVQKQQKSSVVYSPEFNVVARTTFDSITHA